MRILSDTHVRPQDAASLSPASLPPFWDAGSGRPGIMFLEHTSSAPVMECLCRPWPFSPLWTMNSFHTGSMFPEHLFGPRMRCPDRSRIVQPFGYGNSFHHGMYPQSVPH